MSRRRVRDAHGDMLGGTLDMLILQSLRLSPAHGFTIARLIQQRSDAALLVEDGSLYPALHRLEARGSITSYWGTSENNQRARFYRLTTKGHRSMTRCRNRCARLAW